MKTGNRRRRKLNRLAKARALRARCLWYQWEAEEDRRREEFVAAIFAERSTRFVEDASKAA